MAQALLIGIGGFFGSIARYALSGVAQRFAIGGWHFFPVGTLTVNVLGCFALGLLMHVLDERFLIRTEFRLALTIGFLGAFTTFSTYGYETVALVNAGDWRLAAWNFILSNGICLSAVWVGWRLGEMRII